jgi:uncharacterized protein YndB with AHSA1/START domain
MNDGTDEVRLEIWINAFPETVFRLLTDPAAMTTWMAELVDADPRPHGIFHISGPSGLSISGTYLEVVPSRKVVFTWGGVEGVKPGQSTVEFLLEPDRGGTLLRLRHYGLPEPSVEPHRRGWAYSGLVKLKDAAEGRKPARLCLSDIAQLGGAGRRGP